MVLLCAIPSYLRNCFPLCHCSFPWQVPSTGTMGLRISSQVRNRSIWHGGGITPISFWCSQRQILLPFLIKTLLDMRLGSPTSFWPALKPMSHTCVAYKKTTCIWMKRQCLAYGLLSEFQTLYRREGPQAKVSYSRGNYSPSGSWATIWEGLPPFYFR